jgi:V/A-type H+-transporting ATPase subunit I
MVRLHPAETHWFEILVPRDQTVYALETLASSGEVELEHDVLSSLAYDTHALAVSISGAEALRARYGRHLPNVDAHAHLVTEDPGSTAASALTEIRCWLAKQLRLEHRLRSRTRTKHALAVLRECLNAASDLGEELAFFSHSEGLLRKRIYACPRGQQAAVPPNSATVVEVFAGERFDFHVVLCLPEMFAAQDRICRQHHCEPVEVPVWLHDNWSQRYSVIDRRLQTLQAEIGELSDVMESRKHDVALQSALADIAILRWFLDHAIALSDDHRHCIISGWTTVDRPEILQRRLRQAGIEVRILFQACAPIHRAPVGLTDSRFSRLFRPFVTLAGTPGATEVDPSPLLVVLVPLLFGMMFPDVGHGLVIVAAGVVLAPRYPRLRLLIPCGLAAVLCGVVFGEVFGSHTVIPALWFCPLDEPLMMLAASLALGVLVILLGLLLSGVEAYWNRAFGHWLWLDAAVLFFYLGLLLLVFDPSFLLLSIVAAAWYLVGVLVTARQAYGRALVSGIGRFLFSSFELGVNTLSFLRVGAFALAHAALTHTLLEAAAGIDSDGMRLVTLVVGHAAIIAIEASMVFVQTTRLILFEFFSRFLHADGRLMRPLQIPEHR